MNYFRNGLVQRLVATCVAFGLTLSVVLPASSNTSVMAGQIAGQLFGLSMDIPVDDAFWSSWDIARDSDSTTLTDFVSEFVSAYEKSKGISSGTIGSDTHALWNVLMGISINIDPLDAGAMLSAGWKSTVASVSALRGLPVGVIAQSKIVLDNSVSLWSAVRPFTRTLLSSINPQGP